MSPCKVPSVLATAAPTPSVARPLAVSAAPAHAVVTMAAAAAAAGTATATAGAAPPLAEEHLDYGANEEETENAREVEEVSQWPKDRGGCIVYCLLEAVVSQEPVAPEGAEESRQLALVRVRPLPPSHDPLSNLAQLLLIVDPPSVHSLKGGSEARQVVESLDVLDDDGVHRLVVPGRARALLQEATRIGVLWAKDTRRITGDPCEAAVGNLLGVGDESAGPSIIFHCHLLLAEVLRKRKKTLTGMPTRNPYLSKRSHHVDRSELLLAAADNLHDAPGRKDEGVHGLVAPLGEPDHRLRGDGRA